jgi:hypothetical protein
MRWCAAVAWGARRSPCTLGARGEAPNTTTLGDLWLQLGSRTVSKLGSHAREST